MRLPRLSPLRLVQLAGLLSVGLWAVGVRAAGPAPAQAPAAAATAPAAPASSKDPELLWAAGREALAQGDKAGAEQAFRSAIARSELALYFAVKNKPWTEAVVQEALGDTARADAAWAQAFDADLVSATILLRNLVEGPRGAELLARARAEIARRQQALDAGETVPGIPAPDGSVHPLEKLDAKEAIARLKKGEPLKFVYVPDLDLSGQTFTGKLLISRSIIGKLSTYNSHFDDLYVQHAIVGEVHLGQHWSGEVNKSSKLPPGTFTTLGLREVVVAGEAKLEGVRAARLGLFAFATFLGPADLRNAEFPGSLDARFASFAAPAQLRGLDLGGSAYLGHARFDADADLSAIHGRGALVNLDAVRFLGPSTFDSATFDRGATFEGSRFAGPALLTRMHVGEKLALSRVKVDGPVRLDESELAALDMLGAQVVGPLSLADVHVRGTARFALDGGQRRRYEADPAALPRLYRLYIGDEDADPAFFAQPAYGVRGADDLTSNFLGDLNLGNLTVDGRLVMEGVSFGTQQKPIAAVFYGARIGELHLERASLHGRLDLSAMAGHEVSLNRANLDGQVVLDEINIAGRLSLADAQLSPKTDLSFWGASIGAFQIARNQVEREDGSHTLFYELCAGGQLPQAAQDPRLARDVAGAEAKKVCFDHTLDEFSTLQDAFAKQSQPADHDWAYWYQRHYATQRDLVEGDLSTRGSALVQYLVFEKGFGWGVRLGNILITALLMSLIFSFIYRAACHDTEVKFNGEIHVLKNMSQFALFTMSLQSIIGANIGWEVMGKDRRFKYVNTILTIIGIILITFFVGAYTRMVLA